MALYTRDSVERLREAVDMVDLVGARTDLRRVGSRWVGLCPFHDERTPSFSVNADERLYYCFGCEAKGDAIRFVQDTEALDFREAVELLAERYGVELALEREDEAEGRRRRRRERLLALLERAARFYATYLWDSGEAQAARAYLAGRGLSPEVLRAFRVGYAASAWDRVTLAAQRDGFTAEELMATGLAQRGRGGGLYDRFGGRITFPLADARGRVLGFGARAMGEGRGPKYLNTSENELYHKGRQLFGIDLARAQAARAGRVVVVEGYTDVLALHDAGVREAVAIMGTAVTAEQLAELARAAPVVYLALDADRAGRDAMARAARGAEERRIELRVVELPDGRDPADLLADAGPEAFGARLERALPALEFQVRRVFADARLEAPEGRDRALEETADLIATGTKRRTAVRDHLIRLVADRLDVPPHYVADRVEAPRQPRGRAAGSAAPSGSAGGEDRRPTGVGGAARPAGVERAAAAERAFLVLCAASGERGRDYLASLTDAHLSSDLLRQARAHLLRHFGDPLEALPEDDPALAALVTGIATEAGEQESAPHAVLRMSALQLELRRVERELRRARAAGDLGRQDHLAGARQEVRREMDAVMGQTA